VRGAARLLHVRVGAPDAFPWLINFTMMLGVFSSWDEKFGGVTSNVLWDVERGVRILIKKLIT
jgi:hypothetical protein